MSQAELLRVEVCVRVVSGEFCVAEAAMRLGLSYRHMKRLLRRYRERGASGLMHQSVGRSSNRSRPLVEIRVRALDLIREHYGGPPEERFGPTLAAEHLESEHGLKVCSETLRLWMLEAGLWSLSRRRQPYRQRRERRAHFGELVQVDGSFHRWLEDRGPTGCMITYIDDSRGEVLARFAEGETTWAVAEVLELWISRYGIPRALYADAGGVFRSPATSRSRDLRKVPGVSQFGRMCRQLGIRLMTARSPQAKGRVERTHGTHQDRLIKKMRRAGISSYADANRFLDGYLAEHNERFSVASREAADFHLPLGSSVDLSRVFSIHSERRVSLDSVVCYNRRRFQLTRTLRTIAGQKVSVEESRDGSIRIFAAGTDLPFTQIIDRVSRTAAGGEAERVADYNSVHRRPSDSHPWRQRGYDRAVAEQMRKARVASFQTPPAEPEKLSITT
jgi:transposase